jgi:hypothetical protein
MSNIVQEYAETAVIERSEDGCENDQYPVARISFSTFVLRVPVPSDN